MLSQDRIKYCIQILSDEQNYEKVILLAQCMMRAKKRQCNSKEWELIKANFFKKCFVVALNEMIEVNFFDYDN